MESVMTNPMAPAAYYFYTPEQTPDARRHGNFIPQQQLQHPQQQPAYYYMMPPTPTYSRPSSSSSQQHQQQHQPQPVLMSQPQPLKPYTGGAAYAMSAASYVVGSNGRRSMAGVNGKPTIMLETDFVDADGLRLPSTPPLSSTSSTTGSPGACDMLATPLNPMFSGLDNFEGVKDANVTDVATEQYNAAAWSNCASPPFTPVFIPQAQSQSAKALAQNNGRPTPAALTSDLLSVSACPSLSPSPSPYARSVASEQDNDFCDPRNLTVNGSEGSLSPAFSAIQSSLSPAADVEDDFVLRSEPTPAACAKAVPASVISPAAATADFVPHSLAVLEEFPDLESDDDFVNTLVNLGAEYSSASSIATAADLSIRSRASSSATAQSELEFFDSWESSFESTESQQLHPSKRQRTSSGSFVIMSTVAESDADAPAASGNSEQSNEAHDEHEHDHSDASNSDSAGMSGDSASPEEDDGGDDMSSAPVPTNRRGRKQSLTEDPSKIFACDLCNRRFRRQEHLKRHYRSLHTHDKPFNCHECGKKFSRSDNLAQHARTHGAGAMVMNVFDDPDLVAAASGGFVPHLMYPGHPGHPMAMGDDYSGMGRVLFQVAAEIPGSASEHSSDDGSDGQMKKRKRVD